MASKSDMRCGRFERQGNYMCISVVSCGEELVAYTHSTQKSVKERVHQSALAGRDRLPLKQTFQEEILLREEEDNMKDMCISYQIQNECHRRVGNPPFTHVSAAPCVHPTHFSPLRLKF